MGNMTDHAERELRLLGEDPDVVTWMVSVVEQFASYGHSGGSAEICIDYLTRLLNFENLTPITNAPHEWANRSKESGYPIWQAIRNPKLFSEDGGQTFYNVDDADRIFLRSKEV